MSINPAEYMMDLKGRQYLPVAPRVVMFRDDHPAWTITSELVTAGNAQLIRATIADETGRTIATAYKTVRAFAGGDIEKAETGAVGRALSLCGYGTIAALDLDEGDDISDAPVSRPAGHANGNGKGSGPDIGPLLARINAQDTEEGFVRARNHVDTLPANVRKHPAIVSAMSAAAERAASTQLPVSSLTGGGSGDSAAAAPTGERE